MGSDFRYTVRQPISNDHQLDPQGLVLAEYNTVVQCEAWIDGEWRAFTRSEHYRPGQYLQRYIWDERLLKRIPHDT